MPEIQESNVSSSEAISAEPSAASVVFDSVKSSLADLCAKGKVQYELKNYEQAADLYSRATELQAELNGEMDPDNAEILFLYGQSLFKLGQSKSDVLGGGTTAKRKKLEPSRAVPAGEIKEKIEPDSNGRVNDEISNVPNKKESSKNEQIQIDDSKKPFFQFTGDENFEESDEDSKEILSGDDENEDDEEEDELAAAFDVLDLSRILLQKKLESLRSTDEKEEIASSLQMIYHYKERLADTHDLLAEISLENERFSAAVTDCRAALAYKQELFTEERSIIAEAHFKLSLALEFASITSTADEMTKTKEGSLEIDQTLRDEAVKEMEAAIRSTELKIQAKEAEISHIDSHSETETVRHQISEAKDMLIELRARLEELRGPALDVKSVLYGKLTDESGLLGSNSLDKLHPAVAIRVEETKNNANDVTGLVRKRPKAVEASDASETNGKRRAEDNEENECKKAKVGNVDSEAANEK